MGGLFEDETQKLPQEGPGQGAQEAPVQEAAFCFACGAKIPEEFAFCGQCGQPRRSAKSMRRVAQALEQQQLEAAQLEAGQAQGNPISILELEGVDAAITAMTPAYYAGQKAQISKDGAAILSAIYRPYLYTEELPKARSADGRRVRALGETLDALEGWLGMIKAYEYYRKTAPVHASSIAELWSGIGDWAK